MHEAFLWLVPKEYLCPICGEIHDFTLDTEGTLISFNSPGFRLYCKHHQNSKIYFEFWCYWKPYFKYFVYSIKPVCTKINPIINEIVPLSAMRIYKNDPIIIYFKQLFIANSDVGSEECRDCIYNNICYLVKLGDKGDKRHLNMTIAFKCTRERYNHFEKLINIDKALEAETIKHMESPTANTKEAIRKIQHKYMDFM